MQANERVENWGGTIASFPHTVVRPLRVKEIKEVLRNSIQLPCASVLSLHDALRGPFAQERGLLVEVDDRRGGTRPVVRSPYRFSRSSCEIRGPAPRQGEHSAAILKELLGYDDGRIAELREAGVLREGAEP